MCNTRKPTGLKNNVYTNDANDLNALNGVKGCNVGINNELWLGGVMSRCKQVAMLLRLGGVGASVQRSESRPKELCTRNMTNGEASPGVVSDILSGSEALLSPEKAGLEAGSACLPDLERFTSIDCE